ncbi:MAG: uracil-DNA glycosylase [Gemmatimonadetes bacterium]|nr:uracil-DNA glycosylase [Gemmatimonadota bacterium]
MDDRAGAAAERLAEIEQDVIGCARCPRLVEWRERVSSEKRRAYASEEYWGKPVPGFGDPSARLLIVGLAPAAHGANRTGRMFTGDRSGDWLYRALHRAGFASQASSTHLDDGLELTDAWITAGVRCAPPDNKPSTQERDHCAPFLQEELSCLLPQLRVVVVLGGFAHTLTLRLLADRGFCVPRPRPKFGHCGEVDLGSLTVLASYHPSQQNTFTGRLTEEMFDRVWERARALISPGISG